MLFYVAFFWLEHEVESWNTRHVAFCFHDRRVMLRSIMMGVEYRSLCSVYHILMKYYTV